MNVCFYYACTTSAGASIGKVYGSLYEPKTFGSGGAGATNTSAKGIFPRYHLTPNHNSACMYFIFQCKQSKDPEQ